MFIVKLDCLPETVEDPRGSELILLIQFPEHRVHSFPCILRSRESGRAGLFWKLGGVITLCNKIIKLIRNKYLFIFS